MANTRQIDYPKDKLHVMWVTDGSSDKTNERLSLYDDVTIVFSPERRGKTAALKHGIKEVKTDIVVMTDANTMIGKEAIRVIVDHMRDPKVGCVAGEKRVMARDDSQAAAEGEGIYWKYESALKRLDYELHSAMGAAGELCAIRTALFEDMPDDTLLDDFIISMRIVERGYVIAYDSNAYAMEYGSADIVEENKCIHRLGAGRPAAGGLRLCHFPNARRADFHPADDRRRRHPTDDEPPEHTQLQRLRHQPADAGRHPDLRRQRP